VLISIVAELIEFMFIFYSYLSNSKVLKSKTDLYRARYCRWM